MTVAARVWALAFGGFSDESGNDHPGPGPRPGVRAVRTEPEVVAPSDQALAAAIRVGSQEAFTELYERYLDQLLRFAHTLAQDASVAEDIVADTFMSVWNKRAQWPPCESVRAYLFTSVRHRALNVLRGGRRLRAAH